MRPWWTFASCAILPVVLVAVLAWRARSAAVVEAREAEMARCIQAANSAERELEDRLAAARRILSALPEGSDPVITAPPPSLIPIVLDASGRLAIPAPPKGDEPASPECLQARADLLGPRRAAARETILEGCPRVRSPTGRSLWPLLALEAPESARRAPRWLAENGAQLSEAERETLRARGLDVPSAPSNDAVTLQTLLDDGHADETVDGALRIRRGAYVAVQRTFADRHSSGLVMSARSVLAAPPMLPDDLVLAVGGAATARVTVAPQLVFHVLAKDPRASAARVARAGTTVLALAASSLVAALVLAGILHARFLRARKLAELRTDFVAAVSHELRTPAATVLMLSELLEQHAVSEEERHEVEESLAHEARRLSGTLTRMLRFGALSRGKLTTTLAPARPRAIADAAVGRFRRAFPDRSVDVVVDGDRDGLLDAGLLGLALDNLLGNAAKYAPAGGPYRLTMVVRDATLVISVSDYGSGLDKAALSRIFLPFERADDRLTKATEGTGIGLALVRGIAEAHGGIARAESAPTKGATFIIEVPWKPC